MEKQRQEDALRRLSAGMKSILEAELSAGNEIKEVWEGQFTGQTADHTFVFLKKEFQNAIREDLEGIRYRLVDDRHYWKADYYDEAHRQIIACNFEVN